MELLSHAGAGPDRQAYYGAARLDRIFFTLFTARARAYYRRLERTTYDPLGREDGVRDERKAGVLFTLGRQIARLGSVTGGLRLEHINYRDSRFPGKVSLDVRTITLRSEVETLDRVPFPTRGHHNIVQLDLTGKLLGGDVEYTRIYTSLGTYFTPTPLLTYHPTFTLGISRIGLPPTEQFYMGGLHSFSGLRTHQLAGDKLILLNQELRVRLPLRWYLTGHFDIGEVYKSTDEIKLSNLRHGIGATLAFDSPLGPLEFGYGVELDSDIDRWYFRAGFSF
ncbi:MAG: hypothetical protein D6800_08015 [Candidatus Zixiibacteriota bacterium]|nr:MAG: hypothetical protein D6800_08015 [candidate division Zixibacteria bacterium]